MHHAFSNVKDAIAGSIRGKHDAASCDSSASTFQIRNVKKTDGASVDLEETLRPLFESITSTERRKMLAKMVLFLFHGKIENGEFRSVVMDIQDCSMSDDQRKSEIERLLNFNATAGKQQASALCSKWNGPPSSYSSKSNNMDCQCLFFSRGMSWLSSLWRKMPMVVECASHDISDLTNPPRVGMDAGAPLPIP